MNGTVRCLAFTPDSSRLLSAGSDGEVYVWDLGTRECVHTFADEGYGLPPLRDVGATGGGSDLAR